MSTETNREFAARNAARAGEAATDAAEAIREGSMAEAEELLTEAFSRLMDVKETLREGVR
jgi:hypothetical protein